MTRIISVVLLVGFSAFAAASLAQHDPAPAQPAPPAFATKLPPSRTNNLWYEYNNSPTVFVFVHGLLGDSRDTWLATDGAGAPKQYWPELALRDPSLGKMSIFLGGYYSAFDAGNYGVGDAAAELWGALNRKPLYFGEQPVAESVMDKKNIVFITHSTGGIVARYVLHQYRESFRDKVVGLMLIASPSYGSKTADTLAVLVDLYQQKQAAQLRWGSDLVVDLDKNFKNMVYKRTIPNLVGVEALENHFIIHRKFLPNRLILVDETSAGRYFRAPVRLRDTDHFTVVKPPHRTHPAHELLADFMRDDVNPAIKAAAAAAETRVGSLRDDVMGVRGVFEKLEDSPLAATQVQARAAPLGDELSSIPDNFLTLRTQFVKYSYATYAYTMAARVEHQAAKRVDLASRGLKEGDSAMEIMKAADALAGMGDASARDMVRWLAERNAANFIRYQMAFAHAVRLRGGGSSTAEDVKTLAKQIDAKYWKEYPAPRDSDLELVMRGTAL
jgi:pimeloyl-ACP methyl ester carboxylesterase